MTAQQHDGLDPAKAKADHEDHLGGADGMCVGQRLLIGQTTTGVKWNDHCLTYRLADLALQTIEQRARAEKAEAALARVRTIAQSRRRQAEIVAALDLQTLGAQYQQKRRIRHYLDEAELIEAALADPPEAVTL